MLEDEKNIIEEIVEEEEIENLKMTQMKLF